MSGSYNDAYIQCIADQVEKARVGAIIELVPVVKTDNTTHVLRIEQDRGDMLISVNRELQRRAGRSERPQPTLARWKRLLHRGGRRG